MLISKIVEASDRAKSLKTGVDLAVRKLEKEADQLKRFHELVFRLTRSWRDDDPGKYGVHAFFVRSYDLVPQPRGLPYAKNVVKFWVAELADEPQEIVLGRKPIFGAKDERKPVPLGTLAEAKHENCPHCRQEALIIGTQHQVYDSPEGDDWERNLIVLCPSCLAATTIAHEIQGYRF